jgi:UvrD/REP helicase N-terminal domain
LKDVGPIDGRQILSARVDQSHRLIVLRLGDTEYGVLHLLAHDDYTLWLDRTERLSGKALQSAGEVSPDGRVFLSNRLSREAVKPTEDPLAEIRATLAGGMRSFLAFLSPEQRRLVNYDLAARKGVTLVKGGAGTGKTAIAIGRVAFLASQPEIGRAGVLYLCYNRVLVNVVRDVLDHEFGGRYPHGFIHAKTLHEWAWDFLHSRGKRPAVADSRAAQSEAVARIEKLLQERFIPNAPGWAYGGFRSRRDSRSNSTEWLRGCRPVLES